MSGLSGQGRTPQSPVRERRNADNLSAVLEFIDPSEPIQIGGEGTFVLQLTADGGLVVVDSALGIKLQTNPGLSLTADGLIAVVQAPLAIDASGIKLNFGDGLANTADNLVIDLATDPGLEFDSGDLRVLLDATDAGLVRDSDGLNLIDGVPRWRKYSVVFGDLNGVAALTHNFQFFVLPGGGIINAVKIKHSTAFAGTGITALNVSVGTIDDDQEDKYSGTIDVSSIVANDNYRHDILPGDEDHVSSKSIRLFATATGANLDQLTAGALDVWVQWSTAV